MNRSRCDSESEFARRLHRLLACARDVLTVAIREPKVSCLIDHEGRDDNAGPIRLLASSLEPGANRCLTAYMLSWRRGANALGNPFWSHILV